ASRRVYPCDVSLAWLGCTYVGASRRRESRSVLESLAEPRDVCLKRLRSGGGRMRHVEVVEYAVDGDRLPAVNEQDCQESPLFGTERNCPITQTDLERAQNADVHGSVTRL